MAVNKYAAIRHRIIDQKIGNKYQPYPTKESLRQACEESLYGGISGNNISDSTIEKDLNYLKMEYDAPIKFSRSHNGYYYEEEGYSIDLNTDQIEAIKMAANVLSQFKNTEVFSEFHSAIDKILDRVNISPDIQDKAIQQYVQFEKSPVVVGTGYLGDILQAIKNKVSITIGYKKFQAEDEKDRSINPYLLKEYQNRWYVIGFDNFDGFVKTYSLDRVTKLLIVGKSFEIDDGFDYDRFFKYNIGITTLDKEPEDILLSASPLEGSYLKSQPLHWSQNVIIDNENECKLRLRVVVTKELAMKILSMGGGIKVISPKSLKNQIAAEIKKASSNYL